jgi:hypothetical protein
VGTLLGRSGVGVENLARIVEVAIVVVVISGVLLAVTIGAIRSR